VAKGKKRQRSPSVISISDSEESSEKGNQVAGPSSRPPKKVKVEGEDKWERWRHEVEIETRAHVMLARELHAFGVDDTLIEGAMRKLRGGV